VSGDAIAKAVVGIEEDEIGLGGQSTCIP